MALAKTGKPVGEARVELIYQALFDAILAQELTPGTKLSEEAIGAFFGVSRTVVRAVFNRLQSISVIELRPNRGAFVASPSVEEARNVFEARRCIERQIAETLASRITDAQIVELEAHLAAEHDAHHGPNPARAITLSGEFHMLAARMAGNDVMVRILGELVTRSSLVLAMHSRHNASDCGLDEHRAIIDAFRSRDPAAAAKAMTSHLDDIVERTLLGGRRQAMPNLTDILSRFAKPVGAS